MADKWMDERERQMREREWRRPERYGRGLDRSGEDYRGGRGGEDRSFGGDDRVFGERETGASYGRGVGGGRPGYPGGGYRGGYGAGRPAWQDRDYGGTSPAFPTEEDSRGYGRPYGGRSRHGYDHDRDRGERFEDAGRSAGEFLHRAGERVASWFGGEDRDGYGPDRRDLHDRGHRGLGPKGYKRSDERINEDAHERLTDDLWLDASNVSISVSDGEVTLSGTVESREAKHRAERLVEDLAGVTHVQNNLRAVRGGVLTGPSSGFGDSVLDAQMRQDDPGASGSGGTGAGQSSAGRKS